MPKLTEQDIKTAISMEQVRLFSIDTNVFDAYKHGLEFGLLKTLGQFKGKGVTFCLSEIVYRELQAHMIKECDESVRKFSTALKSLKGSWAIDVKAVEDAKKLLLNDMSEQDRTLLRLNNFKNSTGLAIVPAKGNVEVDFLVESYFQSIPPFALKTDKKNEFPDAIALKSLEALADSQSSMMLVVSNDSGWAEYCALSRSLICVNELGKALSLLQKLPNMIITHLNDRFLAGELPKLSIAIEEEIQRYIESSITFAEASAAFHFDYDSIEAIFIGFTEDPNPRFQIVDHDPSLNSYLIEMTLNVEIEASCDFVFYVTDEGDDIPLGDSTVTERNTERISLIVDIDGDIEDQFDIISVETIDGPTRFNFGYISPDYQHEYYED